ncbi:hypothetical protein BLNAU_7407 [Blattamonas nauphoetae]|uniref:Uncharacterized protein n=1 Tax=Blattamonas nauphoetae TaxID=2049346 RepID=A0ABQ9Y194_9EUKA|nr:hypothetical protein BLNAU_7407 [Blattamonas nauphoetae]
MGLHVPRHYFDPSIRMESPVTQLVITIFACSFVLIGLILLIVQASFTFMDRVPHRLVSSFISLYTSLILRLLFIPLLVLLVDPAVCLFGLQNTSALHCNQSAGLALTITGLILAVILVLWNLLQTTLLTASFRSQNSFFSTQMTRTQTLIVLLVTIACVSGTLLSPTLPTVATIVHLVISVAIALLLLHFPPFLSNYINILVSVFPIVSIITSIFSFLSVPLSYTHPIANNLIFFIGLFGFSIAACFGFARLIKLRLDKIVLIHRHKTTSKDTQNGTRAKPLQSQMVGSIYTVMNNMLFEYPHIPNMSPYNAKNPSTNDTSKTPASRPLYDAVDLAARRIKNNVDLNLKLRYLHQPNIMTDDEVVGFTDALYLRVLNRGQFRNDPSTFLSYAQFLGIFRPSQRINIVLTRVTELFPSFPDRFIIYRYVKDIEAQENKLNSPAHKTINPQPNQRAAERSQTNRSEEAIRLSNIARAHMLRFWTMLARKNFDVIRAMKHAEEGISNFTKSKELLQELLKEDTKNPTILRQYASIVREIEGDLVTSSACLTLAENVEDVMLQEDTEAHMREIMKGEQDPAQMRMDGNQDFGSNFTHPDASGVPPSTPPPQTFTVKRKTREDLSIPNALQLSIWESKQVVPLNPISFLFTLLGMVVLFALLIFTSIFILMQSSQSEPETVMIRATIAGSVELNYLFEMMQASFQYTGMITGVDADDEWILENLEENKEYSTDSVLYLNGVLHRMLDVSLETNDWGSKNFEWVVPIENSVDGTIVENLTKYKLNLYDLINWADDLLLESLGDDLNPITNRAAYLHATVTAGLTIPFSLTEEMKKLVFESSTSIEKTDRLIYLMEWTLFAISLTAILLFLFLPTFISLLRTCRSHSKCVAEVCQQTTQQAEAQIQRFNSNADSSQTASQTESFVENDLDDFPIQSPGIKPQMSLHQGRKSVGAGMITPTLSQAAGHKPFIAEMAGEEGADHHLKPTFSLHQRKKSVGAGMVTEALSLASRQGPITGQFSLAEYGNMPIPNTLYQISQVLADPRKKREEIRKKERNRRERAMAQTREVEQMRIENERLLRIENVNAALPSIRSHTLPTSLIVRFAIGIALLAIATCGFFAPTGLFVPQMRQYSSRIVVNEYRRVLVTQISFLADMVSGKFTISPASDDVVILNTQYGTPCFTNTTNFQSVVDLQATLGRTASLFAQMNQIFILGSTDDLITSDPFLDGIEVASSRTYSEDITTLYTAKADCYIDPEDGEVCEGGSVDGLESWFGIDELLQKVTEAAMLIANTPEAELEISMAENTLITQLTWDYLDAGLARIGVYLENSLDSFIQTSRVLVIVLVVVVAVVLAIVSLVLLIPIPFSLRKIHTLSKSLERYGIVRSTQPPVYSSSMETSVQALDDMHQRILNDLTELFSLVHDPSVMGRRRNRNSGTETDFSHGAQKSQTAILQPLSELLLDIVEMFSIEESLMLASCFPSGAMTLHLQAHIDVFVDLLKIYEHALQNKVSEEEGHIFTVSWMKDHISSDDHLLGVYVAENLDHEKLKRAVKEGKRKKNGMLQFPRLMGRSLQESQVVDPVFLMQILQTHNIQF